MPTSRLALLFSTSSLAFALAGPLAAARLVGPEFPVNSYTTGDQGQPAVAGDAAGNFVVVWNSAGQAGGDHGAFAQRFDPAGQPLGAEFQVNAAAAGGATSPEVAATATGDLVVVWQSYLPYPTLHEVRGQRFDSTGVPLGPELQVNTYTTGHQWHPDVGVDAAGNFVVVWDTTHEHIGLTVAGVRAQRFDSTGVPAGAELPVGGDHWDNFKGGAALAVDGSGSFAVTWYACTEPWCGPAVFALRFDAGGVPQGGEFQVNTFWNGYQWGPRMAAAGAGGFVVVWNSGEQDGSDDGVYAQRFDGSGNRLGSEFRVNSYTTGAQNGAAVAADGAGNFIVVWRSAGQDGSGGGVFAQRYDADGNAWGGEFQVNQFTTGDQDAPAVAAGPDGRFVVTWQSAGQDGSGLGVFASILSSGVFSDGFEQGDVCAWSATVGGPCP